MRTFIESRWFALCYFISVIASGICLYVWPRTWLWALLLPFVLWILRSSIKGTLFRYPVIDGGLILFVLTGAVGAWAAYDETAAWNKFCLIVAAVLFYYAMADQPVDNFKVLAGFWFVIGIGIAIYFLLTFDFSAQAEKFQVLHQLGLAWMNMRPGLALPSIHPNDVAGIAIIAGVYGVSFLDGSPRDNRVARIMTLTGLVIVLFAVVLSSSRGAFLALIGSTFILSIWWFLLRQNSPQTKRLLDLLPGLVIIGIVTVGIMEFFIPLRLLGPSFFVSDGVGISRSELIHSGLQILRDFPFTGGGLNSFPGLYSQYVLVIPYYSILNSHNMFLDVAIEQGVLGGISFAAVYLGVVWQLMQMLKKNQTAQIRWLYLAACISLFTAIFHGLVDDYIYGGRGTILAFVPAGMAILVTQCRRMDESLQEFGLQVSGLRTSFFSFKAFIWIAPVILLLGILWRPITAQWYANLGAVKMAKLDLADYPANSWRESTDVQNRRSAELDLRQALAYDEDNQTANHRIGLIQLQARNFEIASNYLLKAYEQDPANRGIIKNLGYSYLWSGEMDKAQSLLERIPEAKYELDIYVWWWSVHERLDLAKQAFDLASRLSK